MKASYETAIAEFLEAGGTVSQLKETESISAHELLRFLEKRGFEVRYFELQRRYTYQGKRITLRALLAMANEQRSALGLPPFVLRVIMTPPSSHRGPKCQGVG